MLKKRFMSMLLVVSMLMGLGVPCLYGLLLLYLLLLLL